MLAMISPLLLGATLEIGGAGTPSLEFHDPSDHNNIDASIDGTITTGLTLKTAATSGATPAARLTATPSGNVGIGTTTPAVKLDVDGGVQASELSVGVSNVNSVAKMEVRSNSGEIFRADAEYAALRLVAHQTGVDMQGAVQVTGAVTCSGDLTASDLRIAGSSTTVADLISNVSSLSTELAALQANFAVSAMPTANQLTVSSCTASSTYSADTCDRAHDGNWASTWQSSNSGASSNHYIQLTLSSTATVTRLKIGQLQDHPDKVAPRVRIQFYDAADTLLWETHHECLMLKSFASYTMTEDFHLFPSVAGVKKLQYNFYGHHPEASKLDNAYRGFRELEVYGHG